MSKTLSHVATLVCNPQAPILTGALGERARAALANAGPVKWLGAQIAADIAFAPEDGFEIVEIETTLRPADGYNQYGKSGAFAFLGEIDTAQTAQAQDDRFVAAVDVYGEARTLAYVVRAVTPGDFAIPGVVAEDMYRPQVYARSKAGRVVVAPARNSAEGGR